mmetsp:Transcript_28664/g.54082  ORF Transcript_28664/g.54082 Transcript_28664/m.54082 type:complete len:229 (-) Transcript_28664:810-1496(-)
MRQGKGFCFHLPALCSWALLHPLLTTIIAGSHGESYHFNVRTGLFGNHCADFRGQSRGFSGGGHAHRHHMGAKDQIVAPPHLLIKGPADRACRLMCRHHLKPIAKAGRTDVVSLDPGHGKDDTSAPHRILVHPHLFNDGRPRPLNIAQIIGVIDDARHVGVLIEHGDWKPVGHLHSFVRLRPTYAALSRTQPGQRRTSPTERPQRGCRAERTHGAFGGPIANLPPARL